MNSQEYWKERALLAKQKEMVSTTEYEAAMRSRLKDLENELIKETKKWLTKYANENNQSLKEAADYLKSIDTSKFDMTLAEFEAKAKAGGYEKELNSAYYKSRIARLQELYRQYQEVAARYADDEEDNMAIGLAKRYEDTYLLENYNKYLVVGGLDVNFAHFNEQELKDIVYQPWQGSNFSKRIWSNYTKVMPEVLTDVMFRSTALGYSYNRVERMLRDKFQGVVKSNIHRLVITEMGHAAEQATAEFYEDSDIEQYQYLATLETHTCEVCAHLDERVFNVKDEKEGVNYPLMHPYCRCTTCGYIKDLPDITSRWSRDPITGKSKFVKNQPYSQWARRNGQKPYSFSEWKQLNGIKQLSINLYRALLPSGAKYYPAYDETEITMGQEERRQNQFARNYYRQMRKSNRQAQIDKVTKVSHLSRDIVSRALIHVLDSQYNLLDYKTMEYVKSKFAPEIDMAHSLQRLINGNPMDHDILLLQHEALEAKLMDDPNSKYYGDYDTAHEETNKKYNYEAECKHLRRLGILPNYSKREDD